MYMYLKFPLKNLNSNSYLYTSQAYTYGVIIAPNVCGKMDNS